MLVIANGSFLLNEAVVNPARRPLAERVVDWADRGRDRSVAMVEGSSVLGDGEMPTLWDLLRRLPAFALGGDPGRPGRAHGDAGARPGWAARARAPPSGADRPAEHALALGALLARAGAAADSPRAARSLPALAASAHARPDEHAACTAPAGAANRRARRWPRHPY